eukprot:CAMPEP_0113851726 /NCGR_PEP_ID=MMETSP0372-20130328/4874_1 /TAXON_ID=340204 /ORGANISM="Lankesteria abbotti" /LENGTH=115 /DNA_ID=CAMNT_0000822715 /DNA_START=563 /DNA_END=907 /DNA_ORIENTATION=+ /assembly_acc=CAM_ASM_000359
MNPCSDKQPVQLSEKMDLPHLVDYKVIQMGGVSVKEERIVRVAVTGLSECVTRATGAGSATDGTMTGRVVVNTVAVQTMTTLMFVKEREYGSCKDEDTLRNLREEETNLFFFKYI